MRRALNRAFDVRHPTRRVQYPSEVVTAVTTEIAGIVSGLDPVTSVFHNANGKALIKHLAVWTVVEDGMRLCVADGVGDGTAGAYGLPGVTIGAIVDHKTAR